MPAAEETFFFLNQSNWKKPNWHSESAAQPVHEDLTHHLSQTCSVLRFFKAGAISGWYTWPWWIRGTSRQRITARTEACCETWGVTEPRTNKLRDFSVWPSILTSQFFECSVSDCHAKFEICDVNIPKLKLPRHVLVHLRVYHLLIKGD